MGAYVGQRMKVATRRQAEQHIPRLRCSAASCTNGGRRSPGRALRPRSTPRARSLGPSRSVLGLAPLDWQPEVAVGQVREQPAGAGRAAADLDHHPRGALHD